MKKLTLCILFLLIFIICVFYSKEERYAKEILGASLMNKCTILRVIKQDLSGGGFAIFLNYPKKEIGEIKQKFNNYTWKKLEFGRELLVNNNNVLRVPEDINGLYIVRINSLDAGLINVIIWDENNDIIVVIAAEATI